MADARHRVSYRRLIAQVAAHDLDRFHGAREVRLSASGEVVEDTDWTPSLHQRIYQM